MVHSGKILRIWLVFLVIHLQTAKIHSFSTPPTILHNLIKKNHCIGITRQQSQPTAAPSTISALNEITRISRCKWSRRPTHLSSQADSNHGGMDMSNFPEPLVWLWSPSQQQYPDQQQQQQQDDEWKQISEIPKLPAAIRTWNWSKHFVLRLNLCPWAKGSLETPSALQIFVVPKEQDIPYTTGSYANDICQSVAEKCQKYCHDYPEMESSIIFFVVFQEEDEDADDCDDYDYDFENNNSDRKATTDGNFHGFYDQWENFIDFHEWFTDLEDAWDIDDIIVAPFHPNWQFGGDGQSTLDFEKKSPYPTVTFVSAKVVEQAGEAATSQIAQKNEDTLQGKTLDDLQETWDDSSSSSPSMPW